MTIIFIEFNTWTKYLKNGYKIIDIYIYIIY